MKAALLFNDSFMESLANLRKIKPDNLAAAVKIKKLFLKLEQEIKIFEEARKEAAIELAEKDQDGNAIIENGNYKFSKESNIKMILKMQGLVNVDIDIEKIKLSELGDLNKLQGLSAGDLLELEPILDSE